MLDAGLAWISLAWKEYCFDINGCMTETVLTDIQGKS